MKYAVVPFIILVALQAGCAAEDAPDEEAPVQRDTAALWPFFSGTSVIFDAKANGGPASLGGCNVWYAWESFTPEASESKAYGRAMLSGDLRSCAHACQQWAQPYTESEKYNYRFNLRHLDVFPNSLNPKTGEAEAYQNNKDTSGLVDRYICRVRHAYPGYAGQDATCFSPPYEVERKKGVFYVDPVEPEGALCDLQTMNPYY